VTARSARVRLIGPVAPRPEASVAVTLAVARLSSEKMDGVVRDAVMLGVRAIRPFVSAYAARPWPIARERAARARWERVAVASAKQCGRAVVPRIAEAVPVEAILAATDEMRLLLVEPAASAVERLSLRKIATLGTPASATLAVGPEGGWRPDEVEQAASLGWRLLQLGPRTLRAEAVPIVALSAVLAMWGEL
jgi:16S rRNA (uracil1498-N3)-methyltransferase